MQEDTYTLSSPSHKSAVFAMGCFWCGEEAFEHYAPGVTEAVSGYAGGENTYPTYRNHPGHYEVVLVEYDPTKTSYEVLVEYAFRNIDPFDGRGQFCDKGSSYFPAIFYETAEEQIQAAIVLQNILNETSWDESTLQVPFLKRPTFWKAEEYHQDYYIKNPGNYGFYKNACGRTKRLKEVWGEETYDCYHDLDVPCKDAILNANGTIVKADINVKGIEEGKAALLGRKHIVLTSLLCALVAVLGVYFFVTRKVHTKSQKREEIV